MEYFHHPRKFPLSPFLSISRPQNESLFWCLSQRLSLPAHEFSLSGFSTYPFLNDRSGTVYTKVVTLSMHFYYCLWFLLSVPLNFLQWLYIASTKNVYIYIYIKQLEESTNLSFVWGNGFTLLKKETHSLLPRINLLRYQQELSSLPGISKFINAEWSLNLGTCFSHC